MLIMVLPVTLRLTALPAAVSTLCWPSANTVTL